MVKRVKRLHDYEIRKQVWKAKKAKRIKDNG
jgi:hypothetical protein